MTNIRGRSRNVAALVFAAAALLVVTGCATPATPGDGGDAAPTGPLDVSVVGQGTVLQLDGEPAEFCLGGVMESYPPQCGGPELVGWDWDAVEGSETAGGVTWGAYAVWGDWDGERLTVTESIMLALYDPMPVEDPFTDEANTGSTSEADLLEIQEAIFDDAPVVVLSSWAENGYLFTQVVYDDGSVQAWADETYGPDVVQVRPALREVE